jgi:hypothetical protein
MSSITGLAGSTKTKRCSYSLTSQAPRPPRSGRGESLLQVGPGRPDLAFRVGPDTIQIGEIKPANLEGFALGVYQLNHYLDKARKSSALKQEYGVTSFKEMDPMLFRLSPAIVRVLSRPYIVFWCEPGLLLYKEKKDPKQKEEEEKAKQRRLSEPKPRAADRHLHIELSVGRQNRVLVVDSGDLTAEEASSLVWGSPAYAGLLTGEVTAAGAPDRFTRFEIARLGPGETQPMRADLRAEYLTAQSNVGVAELPDWLPENVAAAARNGTLAPGIDTTSWTFVWPEGFSSPLIVNRTNAYLEFQALYPEEIEFYEQFAARVDQSPDFARRLHAVCTEWNRDLLYLLASNSSIDDAAGQLRAINLAITQELGSAFGIALSAATSIGRGPPESFGPSRLSVGRATAQTAKLLIRVSRGASSRVPLPPPRIPVAPAL